MWLDLAASGAAGRDDRQKYEAGRKLVASMMTPQQVAEAQRLVHEWKPAAAK
jgi:hypothetical protein